MIRYIALYAMLFWPLFSYGETSGEMSLEFDVKSDSLATAAKKYFTKYARLDSETKKPAESPREIIREVKVAYDVSPKESLVKSTENYLARYVNLDANNKNQQAAEDFLQTMYFISKASCVFKDGILGKQLYCFITPKKIINNITLSGLPASLLEGEIKRKLPIQVGVAIDDDDTLADLLNLTKTRVDTFLKKNGYYGALVTVNAPFAKKNLMMDIEINIGAGVFARVHEVVVSGDVPLRSRVVINQYKRMCLSFNKIIESISLGTLSCYSREMEREATQSLQEKLAHMGYVQSRIRVSHTWLDAQDKNTPSECRTKNTAITSACVNLRISIDKGPLVSWTINVKDALAVKRNAFLRFLSDIFSVDLLSRASIPNNSDEQSLDHVIVEEELLKEITFVASKNVDEQEISQSKKAITDYLISEGYLNAQVVTSFTENTAERIAINFDIFAGRPQFINSVRILPENLSDFIDDDTLYARLKKRSVAHIGSFSYKDVTDTRDAIQDKLNNWGFSKVKITSDIEAQQTGAVDIVFYVESDQRKIVDEIKVINGIDSITEKAVLPMYNCDKYDFPSRYKINRKICQGSSFVVGKLEDDLNRIVDTYQTHGYLYTSGSYALSEDKEGVKIIFSLYDSRYENDKNRPLVKQDIKDIFISGNVSTNEDVIRRLFPKERRSKILDPIGLKKGLANLRESGRFSRIDDRKIMAGEENSDDVYFLLHVTERPSLSFDTGISFSTDQLFMAEAELEEANFLSSMLKLNTSLGLGLFWGRQTIFSNKLIWPAIYGKPLQLTLTAPTIVYDDHLHRPVPRRRLRSEVSLALEWRLTDLVTPYLKYRLFLKQVQNFTKDTLPNKSFSEQVQTLDGLIPTLKSATSIRGVFKPGISYVDVDNQFNPHKGVDMNWWTEFSGGPFIGHPPFINLGWQNRIFIPLGPLTLAIQATVMRAFIKPQADYWEELKDASTMDSLGGDRTIRGYPHGSIGIYDVAGPVTDYAGYFENIANVELRFPLSTKGDLGNFSGAIFLDQGMLIPCSSLFGCMRETSLKNLSLKKGLGLSIGPALRYALPVGPISLDYGISLLTGEGRIHLLFGYAF